MQTSTLYLCVWMLNSCDVYCTNAHTLLKLSRIVNSQSKNNSPKMEIYCIMRNLILALWFYNNKVCVIHMCIGRWAVLD